jgi:hypothetical protein
VKKAVLWAGALLLLGAVVGCAENHDSLTKKQIDLMNDLADVLSTIKDADSAKAAQPKLKKISERMQELKKKAEKLGEPPADKKAALEKKYQDQVTKAGERLMKEFFRVMTVSGAAEALQGLGKDFELQK